MAFISDEMLNEGHGINWEALFALILYFRI